MTSTTNAQEINSITFGIYSETDILNMSVCSINNPRKSGIGTVYDPRLGTTDSSEECQTCKQDAASCPGHFGHIELNEPVVHPLFTKRVVHFLNCICMKCNRLLIGKDQINLIGINKYKGQRKFTAIVEKLKKIDICCQPTGKKDSNGDEIFCGKDHPTVKFNNSDNSFSIIYENNKKNSKQKTSVILSVEEIVKIFDNIPDSDVELMGFNPELVHPRNFVITVLPVCPPCDRPFVKADGKTCDDDLTIQYMEIIKANNNLSRDETLDSYKKKKRKEQTEQDKAKARASLRFRILTTFNNSQGKAKHTTNNRAIKSIKDRLTGKDGQIRMNVQGKRSVTRETVVWLWDGKMKTADEIQVGDIVIGDDGEPRNVIDTVQGKSLIYKIKQNDGYDYRVSDEHILTLKYCGHCEIYWQKTQGKYGGYQMNWFDRETNNIKSVKVSVKPSLSVLDAKMDLQEFMEENGLEDKKNKLESKKKKRWYVEN